MWVRSLGWEYPLEQEMATHSSIFAWKIPWTKEPGGLQSMGLQKSQTQQLNNPKPPVLSSPAPSFLATTSLFSL